MSTETRETKKITVAGHEIEFKSYLTGREANDAKSVLFAGITVEPGAAEKPKVPLSNVQPYERKIFEMLIVSFDGVPENAMENFENLPSTQYDEAVAAIKKESSAFLGQTK